MSKIVMFNQMGSGFALPGLQQGLPLSLERD
ncbi:Uncharacterised protein [Leclercia adecarboxylata]|uniref:Uncharacterized protein n=1 Tax=Leclercia adecarboxylata TaxID=83655 RepID=A0A4U9HVK8_9ENTR|nr:Uncharacterised protein [Leclercia adecarboxylata]